jgi:PIN domain nuclease of toxin-antitoxin system
VRVLLDTHVWLWWFLEPDRLGGKAKALIGRTGTTPVLSAASSWEIAIKHALGKLKLPEPPSRYVPSRLGAQGMRSIAVEHAHALRVATLPRHHDDPFDRLLIAQAQIERMPVLTADARFLPYEVDVLWAGTRPPTGVSEALEAWGTRRRGPPTARSRPRRPRRARARR